MQPNSGLSLKDDIAEIWTDTAYHDVTIVCADGVELGVCRAVLAARCPVFKAMLYGNMQESISQRVVLHDIKSAELTIVLGYIYTESIEDTDVAIAVDIYRAASFLLLPKLKAMVLECAQNVSDFGVSSFLLNEAASSIPWSEANKDLYNVLLKPFYTRRLVIGELTDLSEEALELLFTARFATTFLTPEHDLLLCIVDWVWAHGDEPGPNIAERHDILSLVASMVPGCEGKIRLGNNTLLLNMMRHLDLTLVCPHRLKSVTEAVDGFMETSPHYMSFAHHACKNTVCPTGHPSGYRKSQNHESQNIQWDRSKIGSRVIVSEDGKDVGLSVGTSASTKHAARISVPGTMTPEGLYEWDIVVESVGLLDGCAINEIGLVEEEFSGFDSVLWNKPSAWAFHCYQNYRKVTGSGVTRNYGVNLHNGDVVTLHLDKSNHTCALSVNGVNQGIAWTDLPDNVYPAVTLWNQAKYRIKDPIQI